MKLSGAPLPLGAPRHETQQPPHRYATAKIAPIRRVSFHFTEFHFPEFQSSMPRHI